MMEKSQSGPPAEIRTRSGRVVKQPKYLKNMKCELYELLS